MSENVIVEIEGLYKIFGHRAKERALPMLKDGHSKAEILKKTGCTVGIDNASFKVRKREIFVIMGLSGSGKSTVVRCVNRLIPATAGAIRVAGVNVPEAKEEALRELRRKKMSMVFQRFGLLPHRSVIDNVAFGLEIQKIDRDERYDKARKAIDLVGLDGYEESMTQALSGGMQQRVGLARALAGDPEILLMDEAFSALDPLIRVQLQDELLELQSRQHRTILFITHDLDEALKLGDRIAIMKDGAVVQVGTPEEILSHPADDYVRDFVENVDRSKVITAGTVSRKTEVAYLNHGPHQALRQMRKQATDYLYVCDTDRNFKGIIKLDEVAELADKTEKSDDARATIQPVLHTEYFTTRPDTPIAELLETSAQNVIPLAVVEESGHFRGIVTRSAILEGIAGKAAS
ncbi:MAG: glycine betaine/L-proline ABC transporter ATP-binding protein [Opitutales bacterium]